MIRLSQIPKKKIKDKRYIDVEALEQALQHNLDSVIENNKGIQLQDIQSVGILENGKLQFKLPRNIKDRQVILLLAFNRWFLE